MRTCTPESLSSIFLLTSSPQSLCYYGNNKALRSGSHEQDPRSNVRPRVTAHPEQDLGTTGTHRPEGQHVASPPLPLSAGPVCVEGFWKEQMDVIQGRDLISHLSSSFSKGWWAG